MAHRTATVAALPFAPAGALTACGSGDASPTGSASASSGGGETATHVGVTETVTVTGPTGKTIEVDARIDTGATGSSIDDDLARELGFDLDDAEKVKVSSALGTDERPVVVGGLQVAGRSTDARFTVTDRGRRSTQVLIGRRDAAGFHVVVGQDVEDD